MDREHLLFIIGLASENLENNSKKDVDAPRAIDIDYELSAFQGMLGKAFCAHFQL